MSTKFKTSIVMKRSRIVIGDGVSNNYKLGYVVEYHETDDALKFITKAFQEIHSS